MSKCKVCKAVIENKYSSTQVTCNYKCALEYTRRQNKKDMAKQVKEKNKRFAERRAAAKPKGKIMGEAQKAFNEYVRYRDKDLPCINTGVQVSHDGNDSDAAHYISRAANSAMRFDLRNVHKSTKASNKFQEKYIHDYTVNLRERLGEERFNQLMQDATYYKTHKRGFNKVYLERVKKIFRKKLRVLKKIREM